MKTIFYTILFCFVLLNKTNCQDEFEKNRIIGTYRQDIKEIFDQKIRIKFKNNILGTGPESENDSYFFPPDKLVDAKYEALCYYSGHRGLAVIFICDNKIFYRTNKVPFPHYRITKESEIENHKNYAYNEFINAIERPLEDEEKKDFIENGFIPLLAN